MIIKRSLHHAAFLIAIFVALYGCSTTTSSLMDIPFLTVTVKVVDEKDQPISGAMVEVSNGQKAVTDFNGIAEVKFGGLGAHNVTVLAQNRVPSTFSVTMPLDRGKTMTARLAQPIEMSANINISANVGGGGRGIGGGLGGNFLGGMIMAQLYPMMFQSMFVSYGYNMELLQYKPGEWTEWNLRNEGDENAMVLKKAFLAGLDNGQEWWQIVLPGEKKDEGMVMEVLFAKKMESIRRMRQRTGKAEPQEVPVTEGWYSAPMSLTPESLEGSVKKRGVKVDVPAGSFTADLLEFGVTAMGQGTLRFWRSKAVPGGLVKAEVVDDDGKILWTSSLSGHGSNAKTLIGSY
ncbi:MAG: hypothetical protein HZA20_11740 [Nitrospirae bacterium]|nr:hypothetical protein [Nitrospirota bacterium]